MSLNKSKVLRTAEKYVLQGKIPAAIDEYRKVVDADPADLTTINTLGDLYVRAGRIPDAIANFSRIADSYREGGFTLKAIAMLKKISKLDPTNIDTAMKLANLYSQQGLLVEARQQYLQVADAYARAGQTRKALEAYQKIADLDPSNTSVRMKLGEIYSREKMPEQAHDAFIMAGAEFLRKGETEQALNANLKAITINSDSRQALTAIATIYTQQGQIDRAINLLCEAFERNPGDIELLTILGRTYLSAGLMDEAERTFLSLVELDRNRYHYLLEVGRRFLQTGDLDRAAEQIDGCLEVLIAKREEDKAIDFLRRILDRDLNHIGALRRLSQIFLRIREDHNLIATLNSLVEAAMQKGDDAEAVAALKELARLEPDEQMHLQRLYNLGIRDIAEGDAPDVVRATGPLDYESAAFDDAFVIRQISEAEILAGHGQVSHAVEILCGILKHTPENVQVHLKLKDIYLRAGMMDKAASECLALARIHEARGETARSSDYLAEAQQLNPLIETGPSHGYEAPAPWAPEPNAESRQPVRQAPEPVVDEAPRIGAASGFSASTGPNNGKEEFDLPSGPGELDWSKYQTGGLDDHAGFVTAPGPVSPSSGPSRVPAQQGEQPDATAFSFGDFVSASNLTDAAQPEPPAESVFGGGSLLASDTMPQVLRDELEGIDFYIAQGYVEIARDTLDRLREEHGDYPEIAARYKVLGVTSEPKADHAPQHVSQPLVAAPQHVPPPPIPEPIDSIPDHADLMFSPEPISPSSNGSPFAEMNLSLEPPVPIVEPPPVSDLTVDVVRGPKDGEKKNFAPFMITKDSGPLNPDLLINLNTSELLNNTAFDADRPLTGPLPSGTQRRVGTADLIDSIVSSIDGSFDYLSAAPPPQQQYPELEEESHLDNQQQAMEDLSRIAQAAGIQTEMTDPFAAEPLPELSPAEIFGSLDALASEPPQTEAPPSDSAKDDLRQMFEELAGSTGDLKPLVDFETHYSLGLAYKDMELLDDAIEEFQMAFKVAGIQDLQGDYIQCCNMLGVCFKRKKMPKVAVMWFLRGMKVQGRPEDEYQALRYEIGSCYEEMGDIDKAIDSFTEVYGIDVNYREVGEKLKQLQAIKRA
jgi:tetratricopeptide (TPR) repeat protein